MFFIASLALSGLMLIFLEFFLPGAIMAVGGSLLLLASLFVFHMMVEGAGPLVLYAAILFVLVFFVVRLALSRVKATGRRGGTVYHSSDQEGFQACLYPKELIGKEGVAATDLKPSGYVKIGGQDYQAISKLGYVDKGSSIEVLSGEGAHLLVKMKDLS